ncbi:hypothetical protein BDY21DRAFT_338048 [Lineolata rhizophorae]|uniref:Uncharacterized protein n=1 Tax=Lineolata rhizophorae TaxID=578093 RepID=A0A6A6P5T8_9PEZI|nr:hypothetical protein BDY21DRAFT_338048 [Lineolata rhizophorae]
MLYFLSSRSMFPQGLPQTRSTNRLTSTARHRRRCTNHKFNSTTILYPTTLARVPKHPTTKTSIRDLGTLITRNLGTSPSRPSQTPLQLPPDSHPNPSHDSVPPTAGSAAPRRDAMRSNPGAPRPRMGGLGGVAGGGARVAFLGARSVRRQMSRVALGSDGMQRRRESASRGASGVRGGGWERR